MVYETKFAWCTPNAHNMAPSSNILIFGSCVEAFPSLVCTFLFIIMIRVLKYFYSTEIVIIVGENCTGFPRVQLSSLSILIAPLFKYFHLSISMSRPCRMEKTALFHKAPPLQLFSFSF